MDDANYGLAIISVFFRLQDGAPMMMMRASFGDNMHLVPRALHPTAQKALLELGTAGRL